MAVDKNPKHTFNFDILLQTKLNQQDWRKHKQQLEDEFQNLQIGIQEGMAVENAQKVVDIFNQAFEKVNMPKIDVSALQSDLDNVAKSFTEALAKINNIDTSAFKGIETTLEHISDTLDDIAPKVGQNVTKATKSAVLSVEKLDKMLAKTGESIKDVESALNFTGKGKRGLAKTGSVELGTVITLYKELNALEAKRQELRKAGSNEDEKQWLARTQSMVKFVSAYEGLSKENKKNAGEHVQKAYEIVQPRSHDARTNLQNLLDRRAGTFSEFNEPWAKESTLQDIKKILSDGISVKGDGKKSSSQLQAEISQEQAKITENVRKIQDITGKLIKNKTYVMYRGVNGDDSNKFETRSDVYNSKAGYGAEYYIDSKKIAGGYAPNDTTGSGHVIEAEIHPRKAIIYDAGGNDYQSVVTNTNFIEWFKKQHKSFNKLDLSTKEGASDENQFVMNQAARKAGFDAIVFENILDHVINEKVGEGTSNHSELGKTIAVLNDSILDIIGFYDVNDGKVSHKMTTDPLQYYMLPEDGDTGWTKFPRGEHTEAGQERIQLEKELQKAERERKKAEKNVKELQAQLQEAPVASSDAKDGQQEKVVIADGVATEETLGKILTILEGKRDSDTGDVSGSDTAPAPAVSDDGSSLLPPSETELDEKEVRLAEEAYDKLYEQLNSIRYEAGEAAKELEKVQQRAQFYGFGSDKTPIQEGRLKNTLSQPSDKKYPGYSRGQFVIDSLKKGHTPIKTPSGDYGLDNSTETGASTYLKTTKAEYEYAKYLYDKIKEMNVGWDEGLRILQSQNGQLEAAQARVEALNAEEERIQQETDAAYEAQAKAHALWNKQQLGGKSVGDSHTEEDVENARKVAESEAQARAEAEAAEKANKRRNELAEQLELYDDDGENAYSLEESEGQKVALQEVLNALKQENLLTDELQAKYDAINAKIDKRISLLKSVRQAYNFFETASSIDYNMYDVDEIQQVIDKRKEIINAIPQDVFDFDESIVDWAEEIKQDNLALEKRVDLLKQVKQGLIDIDSVDDIMSETGDLDSKLSRLGDVASAWGSNVKDADVDEDDDAIDALREFEAAYDRIILKLANGKKISILPNAKGLRALYKYDDGIDSGAYGETEIEDIEFVRKEMQARQENTAAVVEETNAISAQEDAVKSLAEELKRIREESRKYQKEYLWSVGDDLKMNQIGEGYTQVGGDYSDTLYSGERFSLHNHYKAAGVVSGEVAPAFSVGDVIDFGKAKELGTQFFAMIYDGIYTVIDTNDIGKELFDSILFDYKSMVSQIELDAQDKYPEANQKRDYYKYIGQESKQALFELFKNHGLGDKIYSATSDEDLNALASKIYDSKNIVPIADKIKTIIMSAFDYSSSTRGALTKDSPLWGEVSDLLQIAEQKRVNAEQIVNDVFTKLYDIVVNKKVALDTTKSLLPTAEGLDYEAKIKSYEELAAAVKEYFNLQAQLKDELNYTGMRKNAYVMEDSYQDIDTDDGKREQMMKDFNALWSEREKVKKSIKTGNTYISNDGQEYLGSERDLEQLTSEINGLSAAYINLGGSIDDFSSKAKKISTATSWNLFKKAEEQDLANNKVAEEFNKPIQEKMQAIEAALVKQQLNPDSIAVWSALEIDSGKFEDRLNSIAKALGIEIPQAAQQAETAVGGLNNELAETVNRANNIGEQTTGSVPDTGSGQTDGATSDEVKNINDVRDAVARVTTEVKEKTQEFLNEQTAVNKAAQSEVYALGEVEKKVTAIRVALSNVNTLLSNIKKGKDLDTGISNITVNVNHQKDDETPTPQKKDAYALDSTLKNVKGVLERIAANTASLNGVEIQRAVEKNTTATEGVAPEVAKETSTAVTEGTNGIAKVIEKKRADDKGNINSEYANSKTVVRGQKTSDSYQTVKTHMVPKFDEDTKEFLGYKTALVEIIDDFDKIRKENLKAEKDLERAQKKVSEFLAKFQSKTGGNAQYVDGFSDLQNMAAERIDASNIDIVYNKMIELQQKYAELERNFRKGQSSLNPFVNAINKSQNIGNIFGEVQDKFDKLVVKSDELTAKFNELKTLSEQIQDFTKRMEEKPASIKPADFTQFSKQMGEFTALKTQVDSMIRSETDETKKIRTHNAQVEAEAVKELIELYEQLGRAQAIGDKDESARLRGVISTEREKLSSVDYATDMKFKGAKSKGFEAERANVDKGELKTQEAIIKKLNKLYQEYGILVERAGAATGHFAEQLRSEAADKNKAIMNLRESLDIISPETFQGFDEAYDRGRLIESTKQYEALAKKSDADEAKRLTNIANLEKEIGKLRADADATPHSSVKNALEEEIQLRQRLIELQKQGLEMEAIDEAYYRRAAANRTKQARATATQEIKGTKDAFKQAEKDEKEKTAEREKELKSLASEYEKLGKLRAKFEGSRDLEDREELRVLAEQVKQKREALELTTDEVLALREKSAEAYKTEQRLIAAAKAQKAIDDQRKAAAKDEKTTQKDAKKLAAEKKRQAKRNAMFGKAGNAIGRAENLWMSAQGEDSPLPPNLVAQVDELYDKMVALRAEQDKVRNAKTVTPQQQKDLRNHTIEMNALTNEVSELFAEYQKLSGANVDETKTKTTALNSKSPLSAYESELKQYVKSIEGGKAQIKNFDAVTKTLTYTVKTGKNEFTEYTAAVRRADGALVSVRGATKRTETFIEATTRKMKELTSYMSGMAIFSRASQELRRGVQFVREIDLALTELKKVTDQTEEEYDQFLQTAAKTGARLGTTISAVTDATSTFAKLGYTMEQATEMAESAIVYKNVGDNIESTADAADSIISTMKGFGLEASEAMAIVDKFNEVGNRFAITSQGIGEALRLSASALSEGGNSLDESIAMITAANEVVNDPSSVGTALKTLTLRLRGSKTELEEMGEDVTDMATTTSQLQAKLLALTGGQVDIMLDANTFKNSTVILREMSQAWSDMTDIQRAEWCPYVQKCA